MKPIMVTAMVLVRPEGGLDRSFAAEVASLAPPSDCWGGGVCGAATSGGVAAHPLGCLTLVGMLA